MIGVSILGATGSIGQSTLDVIARHPDLFRLVAASAHSDVEGMAAICRAHAPDLVAMVDPAAAAALRQQVETTVLDSAEGLQAVATHAEADQVMAAIVGGAGLAPTMSAACAGKRVLLANKEALVMAGPLFIDAVNHSGAELLPIDSEHNAIFQCLPAGSRCGHAVIGVESLVLTGSGGPLRTLSADEIARVTPEQAVAHPNWAMGRKISVDSATLMNKGLELIEAAFLFGVPRHKIEVLIHPQSVVHSMVRYADGSVLAQLGQPDMRTPIAYSMAHGLPGLDGRIDAGVEPLDFLKLGSLDFCAPDRERFRCLALAEAALDAGAVAMITVNAANEVAVQSFLDRKLGFGQIAETIEAVTTAMMSSNSQPASIDEVLAIDADARRIASECVNRMGAE